MPDSLVNPNYLTLLRDRVTAALIEHGQISAASMLKAGVWRFAGNGLIRVEIAAKQTMLGLTISNEAWKIVQATLQQINRDLRITIAPVKPGRSLESEASSEELTKGTSGADTSNRTNIEKLAVEADSEPFFQETSSTSFPTSTKLVSTIIVIALLGAVVFRMLKRPIANLQVTAGVESRYIDPNSEKHPQPTAVVFVHGIFGDDTTWGTGDLTLPHLLATDTDLSNTLDLFLFEYRSPWLRDAGKISDLAEQLYGALEDHGVWKKHQHVIFVAHSMGGLIVREYLLSHQDHIKQIALMYFYAVPTNGTSITNEAELISNNPQLKGMVPLEGNDFLDSITNSWLNNLQLQALPTRCAYELQDTYSVRIVPESSARALCNDGVDPLDADHIQIVKPTSRTDPRFTRLATTIGDALKSSAVSHAPKVAPVSVSQHASNPVHSAPHAENLLGCQEAIEACTIPQLIQRAFILQQRLKKFAGDWKEEDDFTKQNVAQMEINHQRATGETGQLLPLPPGASETEKSRWQARVRFETWQSDKLMKVYTENKKKYDDQFKTEALQIRDEMVNRYAQARSILGYKEYGDVIGYQQVYLVTAHLQSCIDALGGSVSAHLIPSETR